MESISNQTDSFMAQTSFSIGSKLVLSLQSKHIGKASFERFSLEQILLIIRKKKKMKLASSLLSELNSQPGTAKTLHSPVSVAVIKSLKSFHQLFLKEKTMSGLRTPGTIKSGPNLSFVPTARGLT